MSRPSDERRRAQRVSPPQALPGKIDDAKMFIVNVSIRGMQIAHQNEIKEAERHRVRFAWHGQEIAFNCTVIYTRLDRNTKSGPVYQSGLRFDNAVGESVDALRDVITEHVVRALDEQKANARGVPAMVPTSFQTGSKRGGYLKCQYLNSNWKMTETVEAIQPDNGFTVAATEDRQQIDLLCKTYEESSQDGRKMIRKMAELSISAAHGIPTRKYTP